MATAGAARGSGPERAFAAPLPTSGDVVLDGEESAHLVRSRRARAGDPVVLFDGAGASRAGTLLEADPRAARVRVEGEYPDRRPSRLARLAVALPEMGRADRMVQALAELGVGELVHLACARGDPKRAEQAERRRGRWEKLAREACKVNGCARTMAFGSSLTLDAALAAGAILLDPDPDGVPLAAAALADDCAGWLLVGPEGGFTEAEVQAAHEAAGCFVARLGATALRVETAAIAAAAVILAT